MGIVLLSRFLLCVYTRTLRVPIPVPPARRTQTLASDRFASPTLRVSCVCFLRAQLTLRVSSTAYLYTLPWLRLGLGSLRRPAVGSSHGRCHRAALASLSSSLYRSREAGVISVRVLEGLFSAVVGGEKDAAARCASGLPPRSPLLVLSVLCASRSGGEAGERESEESANEKNTRRLRARSRVAWPFTNGCASSRSRVKITLGPSPPPPFRGVRPGRFFFLFPPVLRSECTTTAAPTLTMENLWRPVSSLPYSTLCLRY